MKPVLMHWNPIVYGATVAEILALAGNGARLMPLAEGACCSDEARRRIRNSKSQDLFASARAPRGSLAGLYLYFSCRDEAHEITQADTTAEGSYWHAIVHRQEPDAGNSSYWFQRVGKHPVFPALLEQARAIEAAHPKANLNLSGAWDPMAFIAVCERARRQPDSELEHAALEIQRAEWQLLFDYCARRSLD
ncbi:MAG TPA: hypothetical protein VK335_05935 [Bryobacteraceae bacterium]|nr:hypothetical protein [Bryobacteraceae bacterium]